MAEREADRRARRLCLCEREGLQQQLGRIGFAEQVPRKADLGQQLGSDSRRGRLGERPAQIPDGTVRGAARLRCSGGRAQRDHSLRIAVRVGCEQVDGGLLGIAGQQLGGAPLHARPLARGGVLVDRGAHDRVREPHGPARREHAELGQRIGERGCRGRLEPRQRARP